MAWRLGEEYRPISKEMAIVLFDPMKGLSLESFLH
jgi:hypothetical protein